MHASKLWFRRLLALSLASMFALVTASTSLAQDDDLFSDVPADSAATDTDAAPAEGEAAAPAAGQQQLTGEDLQRIFKEGDDALKAKDWNKALESYDILVNAFKNSLDPRIQALLPAVYTYRGRAFAGLEDNEAALADFKEALLVDPSNYIPLVARGNLYLDLGANELALADYQLALEQARRNPEVLFGLGKAYVLLGGPQQAIKPLTYAIESDDKNAEAYRLRAQAYAGIGKYPEAYADLEKALELEPDNHENHFTLATILMREEKHPEAVAAMEESIATYKPKEEDSTDPFAQGYLTKAAVLIEIGKKATDDATRQEAYTAALKDCDTLLELIGDKQQYAAIRAATEFRRGTALRLLGDYGEAINAFTEAINVNPDMMEAYFRRGICFYYINEDNLAVSDFKEAGNLGYTDPRPRLWEGFAYAKLGNYHEAIRAYGQALALSDRYVPAYVNRGLAYMALGENEKAINDFHKAIRLEPNEWTHYFKRGVAYERMGDYQKAADSFANAIRFEPDGTYAPAYRHAADALSRMGRNELASEFRNRAVELEAAQQKPQE